MQCVECHTNITDNKAPHKKTDTRKVDCAGCHEKLWNDALRKTGPRRARAWG
jgi:NAD-dependent SIR2 family protein deacetylase